MCVPVLRFKHIKWRSHHDGAGSRQLEDTIMNRRPAINSILKLAQYLSRTLIRAACCRKPNVPVAGVVEIWGPVDRSRGRVVDAEQGDCQLPVC